MLSIGEFSKISQITTKTLRYYDEIGLLKPVQVNPISGYRYYKVEQLKVVLFIQKLKLYNFSLEEIIEILKKEYTNTNLLHAMKQKQKGLLQRQTEMGVVLNQIEIDILNLERGQNLMSYLDSIIVHVQEPTPVRILSIREEMNVDDYGKYIGKLVERIHKEKLTPLGPPMTIYYGEEFRPESYDMEIALPIKEEVEGTRVLNPGTCATANFKGPYSQLTSVYAKVKEWVEKQGYTIAGAPFEFYLNDPANTKPEELITQVFFPIKK